MLITRDQIRAARALKDWSQLELAKRTGLARPTIVNIESGNQDAGAQTLEKIFTVFEKSGVEFSAQEGVRIKEGSVRILQGDEGFWEFFDDVYDMVKNERGSVLISNCDEEIMTRLGKERTPAHLARMSALRGSFECKSLVKENDCFFPAADYTEYRWLPKNQFGSIPFYVYGNKLAILVLKETSLIFLLEHPEAAAAYTNYFRLLWDQAIIPPHSSTEQAAENPATPQKSSAKQKSAAPKTAKRKRSKP